MDQMDKKTVNIAATILLVFCFILESRLRTINLFTAYIYANPCEE